MLIERAGALAAALDGLDGLGRGRRIARAPELADRALSWAPLPPPIRGSIDLDRILAARRAVHYHADDPLSMAELATVCAAMAAGAPGLEVVPFVRDVEGIDPGIYVWRDGRLGLLRRGEADEALRSRWVLQVEFARAPVFVAVAGNLEACGDSLHAYRQLIVDAAKMCHRGWLTAVGIDLAGTMFAGILHGELDALGFDGWSSSLIAAFAFGRPVGVTGSSGGAPQEEGL